LSTIYVQFSTEFSAFVDAGQVFAEQTIRRVRMLLALISDKHLAEEASWLGPGPQIIGIRERMPPI